MEEGIGYYRFSDVMKIFPVCRSAWFAGVRTGKYPAPIKHGRTSFWRKVDIHKLVRAVEQSEGQNLTDIKQQKEEDACKQN